MTVSAFPKQLFLVITPLTNTKKDQFFISMHVQYWRRKRKKRREKITTEDNLNRTGVHHVFQSDIYKTVGLKRVAKMTTKLGP